MEEPVPEVDAEPLALVEERWDLEAATLVVAVGEPLDNGEALPEEQVVGV